MATNAVNDIRTNEAFFNLRDTNDLNTRFFEVKTDAWFGQVFLAQTNELRRLFFMCDDTEGLEVSVHKAIVSGSGTNRTFTPGQRIVSLKHQIGQPNPFHPVKNLNSQETAQWFYPNWLATPQLPETDIEYIVVFKTDEPNRTPLIYYTFDYRQNIFTQIVGYDGGTWSNGNITTRTVGDINTGAICMGYAGNDVSETISLNSGSNIIGGRIAKRGYPVFILADNMSSQTNDITIDFTQIPPSNTANGVSEETDQSMMRWYHFEPSYIPIIGDYGLTNNSIKPKLNNIDNFVIFMQPDRLSPLADSFLPEDELSLISEKIGVVPIYEGMPVRHGRVILRALNRAVIDKSLITSVISKDITTPPAANIGDKYLIGTDRDAGNATGLWATHDGEIAEWTGLQWNFTSPTQGLEVFVETSTSPVDKEFIYRYNGVQFWEKRTSASDDLRDSTNINSNKITDNTKKLSYDFWSHLKIDSEEAVSSNVRDAANSINADYIDLSIEKPEEDIDVLRKIVLSSDELDSAIGTEEVMIRGFNKVIFYKNKYVFICKKLVFPPLSPALTGPPGRFLVYTADADLTNFQKSRLSFTDTTPTSVTADTYFFGINDLVVKEINGVETLLMLIQTDLRSTGGNEDGDFVTLSEFSFNVAYYQGDFENAEETAQLIRPEEPTTITDLKEFGRYEDYLSLIDIDEEGLAKFVDQDSTSSTIISAHNKEEGLGMWEIKPDDDLSSPSYRIPLFKANDIAETGIATKDDLKISFTLKEGGTTYIGTRVPDGKVSSIYRTDDFITFEQLFGGDVSSIIDFNLDLDENETKFMVKVGGILHAWISPSQFGNDNATPLHVAIKIQTKEAKILRKFPILDDGDSFYSSFPQISDLKDYPRSKALRFIQGGAISGNHIYVYGGDKITTGLFESSTEQIASYATRWLIYDDRIINDAFDFADKFVFGSASYTLENDGNEFEITPVKLDGVSAIEYYNYDPEKASGFPPIKDISGLMKTKKGIIWLYEEEDGTVKLCVVLGHTNDETGGLDIYAGFTIDGLPVKSGLELDDDPSDVDQSGRDQFVTNKIPSDRQMTITLGHNVINTDGFIIKGLDTENNWTISVKHDLDIILYKNDVTGDIVVNPTDLTGLTLLLNLSASAGANQTHNEFVFLNGDPTDTTFPGTGVKEAIDLTFDDGEDPVPIVIKKESQELSKLGKYDGKTISTIAHNETSIASKDYPELLPDPSNTSEDRSANPNGPRDPSKTPRALIYCGIINYGGAESDGIDFDNANIPSSLVTSNGINYLICDNMFNGIKAYKAYGIKQLPSNWGQYFRDASKTVEATGLNLAFTNTGTNSNNYDFIDIDKAAYRKATGGETSFKNVARRVIVNQVNGIVFLNELKDNVFNSTGFENVNADFPERPILVLSNSIKQPQMLSLFYRMGVVGDIENIQDEISNPLTSDTVLTVKSAETLEKLFYNPDEIKNIPLAQISPENISDKVLLRSVFKTNKDSNFYRIESSKLFDNGNDRVELRLKGLVMNDINVSPPEGGTGNKKVSITGIVEDENSDPANVIDNGALLPPSGEIIIDLVKPVYISEISFDAQHESFDSLVPDQSSFNLFALTKFDKQSFNDELIPSEDWIKLGSSVKFSSTTNMGSITKDGLGTYAKAIRLTVDSGVTFNISNFTIKGFSGEATAITSSGDVFYPENIIVDDIRGLIDTSGQKSKSCTIFKKSNSIVEFDIDNISPITKISMNITGNAQRTMLVDTWDGTTMSGGNPLYENVYTGPIRNYAYSIVSWTPREKEKSTEVEIDFLDASQIDALGLTGEIGDFIVDNLTNMSGLIMNSGLAGFNFKPNIFGNKNITISRSDTISNIDNPPDGEITVNAQMDEDGPFKTDIRDEGFGIGLIEDNLNIDFPLKQVKKVRITLKSQIDAQDIVRINGLKLFSPLVDSKGNAISPVDLATWDIQLNTNVSDK